MVGGRDQQFREHLLAAQLSSAEEHQRRRSSIGGTEYTGSCGSGFMIDSVFVLDLEMLVVGSPLRYLVPKVCSYVPVYMRR
ncbi:hypothetical protein BDV10DRAFT_177304 [Aspergillus recurvatus]